MRNSDRGSSWSAAISAGLGVHGYRPAAVKASGSTTPTMGAMTNPLTNVGQSSSCPMISTCSSRSPTSSNDSRSAASRGPASDGSMPPPGKLTCPPCARSSLLRSVKSTCTPSGRGRSGTSTAAIRQSTFGGLSGRGSCLESARRICGREGAQPPRPSASRRWAAGAAGARAWRAPAGSAAGRALAASSLAREPEHEDARRDGQTVDGEDGERARPQIGEEPLDDERAHYCRGDAPRGEAVPAERRRPAVHFAQHLGELEQTGAEDDGGRQEEGETRDRLARVAEEKAQGDGGPRAGYAGDERQGLRDADADGVRHGHLLGELVLLAGAVREPEQDAHQGHRDGDEERGAQGLLGIVAEELADDCAGNRRDDEAPEQPSLGGPEKLPIRHRSQPRRNESNPVAPEDDQHR